MLDPILIATLATLSTGFAGLLLRYSFRSKCTDVNICWGAVHIIRDPVQENNEEKMELDKGINLSNDINLNQK